MWPLGAEVVKGVVVKSGFHAEAGAAPWVIVRDRSGVEHYARLKTGAALLTAGRSATLTPLSNGLAQLAVGRDANLAR